MISEAKRRAMLPWVPMIFCAMLSLITVVAQIALTAVNGPGSGGAIDFVAWLNLPLCFFFVGLLIAPLQREVRELRAQLAELKQQRPV